jgi:hypothetical protein
LEKAFIPTLVTVLGIVRLATVFPTLNSATPDPRTLTGRPLIEEGKTTDVALAGPVYFIICI